MKKGFLFLVLLVVAAVAYLLWTRTRAGLESNAIVRIYFAGTNSILSDPLSSPFTNEFGCTEARAMESQALDKLSRAPGAWFKDKLPTGADDGSAQLRPLLDDFLKSEWMFEMRRAPASPEYALAIRLDDARAQLWLTNLQGLLESWTKIKARDITGGWELKKDMPPNMFRIVRAGDWVVVGCGQDELPLSDKWAHDGIPQNETNWLAADLDWPTLAQIFPAFAKFDFPKINAQVIGVNGFLKLTGTFNLSQPLPPLEKWQVPTNLIHQPLTSFTAVRGFAPWLASQPWSKLIRLSPPPDQAFSWSLGLSPFQTFLAVPVPDATNTLALLYQNYVNDTNWHGHFLGIVGLNNTTNVLSVQDVPFIQPEIKALSGPSGNFLFAGAIPGIPFGKAPPQELLRQIDRDDLVFYHWEITSERLVELPELVQLTLLLTKHRQWKQDEPPAKWLNRIGPTQGNCVTEVKQTGPSELTFVRTASAGLTAVELIALANWLEAPDFPGCDLSLPHRPVLHPHKLDKKLMAPATPPPAKP